MLPFDELDLFVTSARAPLAAAMQRKRQSGVSVEQFPSTRRSRNSVNVPCGIASSASPIHGTTTTRPLVNSR
jgi:hypothetical protein